MTDLRHPGADPRCVTCSGIGLRVLREGMFARAVPCSCLASVCPACRDTGFVSTGEGFRAPLRRCGCHETRLRGRRFDAARVPGRYAEATVRNFDVGLGARAAHAFVTGWLDTFEPGTIHRGFVLHGNVGVGKTHLVLGAARELALRHGVTVRVVEFSHLLGDLKSSFDRPGAAADLLEPLVSCDVLVIDELGKGRNTEFEGTVLDELVSRRYNAGATILGTTNYEPKPPTGRAVANPAEGGRMVQPTLADRVGERVFSRLKELCQFTEVIGDDYRVVGSRRRPARRA